MELARTIVDIHGTETAPVIKELLTSALIASRSELTADFRRMEDRPFKPTAGAVLADRRDLNFPLKNRLHFLGMSTLNRVPECLGIMVYFSE